MDDFFYFSQEKVTLDDIIPCAESLGFTIVKFTSAGMPHLTVLETDDRFTQWTDLNDGSAPDPTSSFEVEQQAVLASYDPKAMLMISYHPSSIPGLIRIVRILLERFGGWVGRDDGRFDQKFTAENLADLGLKPTS